MTDRTPNEPFIHLTHGVTMSHHLDADTSTAELVEETSIPREIVDDVMNRRFLLPHERLTAGIYVAMCETATGDRRAKYRQYGPDSAVLTGASWSWGVVGLVVILVGIITSLIVPSHSYGIVVLYFGAVILMPSAVRSYQSESAGRKFLASEKTADA